MPHRLEKSSCLRLIVASESAGVGEAEAGSAGERPSRKSQPGTHQDDELGSDWSNGWSVAPSTSKAHRIERSLMPKKTHALVTPAIDSNRACSISNSTGD